MVTTVISKVGVSKTGGPGVLEYTTLASWETSRRGNIVTRNGGDNDGTIEVAEVYGGGSVGPVALSSTNWTTDSTHYIHIRAAVGHEHGGSFNTSKAYMSYSARNTFISVGCTRIGPGLSIESTGDLTIWCTVSSGGPLTFDGCIIRGNHTTGGLTSYGSCITFNGMNNGTNIVKNCILLSRFNTPVNCDSGAVTVYNCTINGGYVGLYRNGGTLTSQNNYVGGGYQGTITKGANDITNNKDATTSTLRDIPYADSTTTQIWKEAGTDVLPVGGNYIHTAVVYDGKMWMLGGQAGGWKGVYSSTNGTVWTSVGSLSVATYRHTSVVFDAGTGRGLEMWVIGGTGLTAVYSSTDGITWTKRGDLPAWRENASAVVHGGKIWVIGGNTTNTVYSSSDGATWNTENVFPVNLIGHTSLSYDGKIWVIGGFNSNKVYYSTDGTSWTQAGTNTLQNSVGYHASVIYDNKMWVIGGNCRNARYSTDGVTWTGKKSNQLPVVLSQFAAVVYTVSGDTSKMWTVAGVGPTGVTRTVYSFPNTPSFASFQNVTDNSENLRLTVSMSNKLLDSGANLTSEGVTTDVIGTVRPQNGAFDIGAFENDIPLCWNYTAQYKNSSKLYKASGCGSFPKSLRVPNNIDTNTGKMIDDGLLIDPRKYEVR